MPLSFGICEPTNNFCICKKKVKKIPALCDNLFGSRERKQLSFVVTASKTQTQFSPRAFHFHLLNPDGKSIDNSPSGKSRGRGLENRLISGDGVCNFGGRIPTPHNQVTFFVSGVYRDRAAQYFVTALESKKP
jgi:hypothetical protein